MREFSRQNHSGHRTIQVAKSPSSGRVKEGILVIVRAFYEKVIPVGCKLLQGKNKFVTKVFTSVGVSVRTRCSLRQIQKDFIVYSNVFGSNSLKYIFCQLYYFTFSQNKDQPFR